MKIVTFNVNGIRARIHQLEALIVEQSPVIVGLQEIKVHDTEFPHQQLEQLGYHIVHHGQKGHYGVATFSRMEPDSVTKGFPGEEKNHQRRLLITTYPLPSGKRLRIVNGYFPQGDNRDHPEKFPNKKAFYRNLQDWLEQEADPNEYLIVMGDMNIAPEDKDIGIGEDNRKRWLQRGKCSFLPEERDWLSRIENWGLTDLYRTIHPDVSDHFSWFDYRSRGFEQEPKRGLRIDLILGSHPVADLCTDAGIDYRIRAMDRPSDHCPVWAELSLS